MYLLKRGITEGGQRRRRDEERERWRKRDSESGHRGPRIVWWLQTGFLKKKKKKFVRDEKKVVS